MRLRNLLIALGFAAACSSGSDAQPGADAGPEPDAGPGSTSEPPDEGLDAPWPSYESIEVDSRGFVVDGQYRLLRGGTLQWFRMPEEVWDDRLARFKAAGFNTIDMYVAWNVHEPAPGEFQFDQPNLTRFLDLAKAHGLYVYFRPGPYITNELDGGGVPAWVFTSTTKKSKDADGKPNLRTDDPDYLALAERYFDAVNEVIRPYLITNGGPIILYGIENEYDWFEIFFEVDKLFGHGGGPERGLLQKTGVHDYLAALRDMLRADGIDVPITTCPGSGKVAGMGDVAGVIPMPNIYTQGRTEKIAYDIVTSMHDPDRFGGHYTGFPTGSTETDRTPARMQRLFAGGMDAFFAFNVVGMRQGGYRNAVVLNNAGPRSIFDLSVDAVMHAFVSPTVGYFHNVIDYYGAIGPTGALREKFFGFRRANLFFDAFEEEIAAVRHPVRSTDDDRVRIATPGIGADEDGDRVHTWLDAGGGTFFVPLVNETAQVQTIGVGEVEIDGLAVPAHEPITVPTSAYPGDPADGGTELEYAHWLVHGVPLAGGTLRYTTSEVLTRRAFGDDTLLVLHGVAGSRGELRLDGAWTVVATPDTVTVHRDDEQALVVGYEHRAPTTVIVEDGAGARVRILIMTRHLAGRTWLLRSGDTRWLVAGLDHVRGVSGGVISYEHAAADGEVYLLADDGAERTQTLAAGDPLPTLGALPAGRARSDRAEAAPDFDDSTWQAFTGEPRPLEELGIHAGHAWYRAEVVIDEPPEDRWLGWPLYVAHASDFIGIYVNGQYVTTVAPIGTEIDSDSWDSDYAFPDLTEHLVQGRNVIAFRTEIWGHGSFMWPRGKLLGGTGSLPSLGFDAVKGLWGEARVGNRPLTSWRVRAGLGGEQAGFPGDAEVGGWQDASVPLSLEPGDVRWYRVTLPGDAVADPARFNAPAVLRLAGERSKATIFLNGEIIGRWLSDEGWLARGTWSRAIRDMWMNTSPDDFPLLEQTLRPGDNVLAIAFEDASGPEQPAGRITGLSLAYNREVRAFDGDATVRASYRAWRGTLALAP